MENKTLFVEKEAYINKKTGKENFAYIVKDVVNTLEITKKIDTKNDKKLTKIDIYREIDILKSRMAIASSKLDFEAAIQYREAISELKKQLREMQ